jgi:DNA phosphorothioation-associated putative methyltransferase
MAPPTVTRHKTAISRGILSRPVRLALDDGLISAQTTFLDYGCGRGEDVQRLIREGIAAGGWDPADGSSPPSEPAHVVNLGYVVNVIEEPRERCATLRRAWDLAQDTLVVSARLTTELTDANLTPYGDGFLTSRGTFQKFFEQQELRDWVDGTLNENAVAAAPGIFYVFRNEQRKQGFLAARQFRRYALPTVRRSEELFEQHRELLTEVMDFVEMRGRLPRDYELVSAPQIREALGSIRRAFSVVRTVTGRERWDELRQRRTQDLLVFMALQHFGKRRQRRSGLPEALQLDIQAFFSSFARASDLAELLLYSIGDEGMLGDSFDAAAAGRLTDRALFVHESAIPQLPPVLRVYEGVARAYIGAVEGANVVKLHRAKPAVTYMAYDRFDDDPHPVLHRSLRVELHTFDVKYSDYRDWPDPPILSRKDELVGQEYPLRERFVRLSRQEDRYGVPPGGEANTRGGLMRILDGLGLQLKGHRLIKRR